MSFCEYHVLMFSFTLAFQLSWTSPLFWFLAINLVILPVVLWVYIILGMKKHYGWVIKPWVWPMNLGALLLTVSPLTMWVLMSMGHLYLNLFPDPNTTYLTLLFGHLVISPVIWVVMAYANISTGGIFISLHEQVLKYRRAFIIYYLLLYLLGFVMMMIPASPLWNPL